MKKLSPMTKTALNKILRDHAKWLNNPKTGKRADFYNKNLRGANFRNANLRSADFRGADLRGANFRNADLRDANFRNADLRDANLADTDLCNTNLYNTDLRDANLDYACLPLWCGLFDVVIDKRLAAQILYHFLRMKSEDADVLAVQKLPKLRALAEQFHRFAECGGL